MKRRDRLGRWAFAGLAAWAVLGLTAQAASPLPVHPDRSRQAEAGRAAEVYFSEQAEAGDPRFIAKVAHTKLWVPDAAGRISRAGE